MILGFALGDLVVFLLISLAICITVCTLAMEAAVLFTPAFLFLFPELFPSFPALSPNEAIGLAFVVEFFGYTSSVSGYWYRGQIDFAVAAKVLAVTIPLGVLARFVSYVVPEDGLLVAFGVLLVALAWVIYRYHPDDERTCLLCGDAVGMDGDGIAPNGVGGYVPRTSLFRAPERGSNAFDLDRIDRLIVATGGAFAGLVGIAIGEVTNTFLSVRKRLPIKLSTGTSALVLHLTILAVLATNLSVLAVDPGFVDAEAVVIPWMVGVVLAPIVVLGGQIGSLLNSRLSDRTIVRALTAAYPLVGAFVIARTLAV